MRSEINAAFVHDHYFFYDDNEAVYSAGGLPARAWVRYLQHFSNLVVVGRDGGYIKKEASLKHVISSTDNVCFELCDSVSGLGGTFNRKKVREKVSHVVRSVDFVIVRLSSELGLMAISEAIKLNKPYAIELVDCPWDSYWNYGSIMAKFYAPLIRWRVKNAVRNCNNVLYVTRRYLQDKYPPKADANTVGCSNVDIVEAAHYMVAARGDRLRKKAGRGLVIGQIGSLKGKFKGIQTVLYALPKVLEVFPDLEYRVLGGGHSMAWTDLAQKLGVSDHVKFDGVLPAGLAVNKWLDEIDLYVHPSLKEGLPRSVIEAMSRACPVIASDVAGTPELLPNEFLIKVNDHQALADKIISFLNNEVRLTTAMAENVHAAEHFLRDSLERKRFEFFSKLVSSTSERRCAE